VLAWLYTTYLTLIIGLISNKAKDEENFKNQIGRNFNFDKQIFSLIHEVTGQKGTLTFKEMI
jgi:hypothetical protein